MFGENILLPLTNNKQSILEEQTKDALQNGLVKCQGRIICDEKLFVFFLIKFTSLI